MSNKLNQKRLLPFLTSFFAILLILAGTYIFFDNVLLNDHLIGSRVDGRLNTFFVEHWFQVFCGNESWMQLRAFYPAQNVLSYSDVMLGFALPYSLFRLFGVDMYMAFKYSVILVHLLGSIALWFFMNRCLKCSHWASLAAVVGFSFSNGYYAITANPQMFAESLLPIILICAFCYAKYFYDKRRVFFALAGLGLFVLLFYTAFYVAYFTCVFLFLFVPLFCLSACLCIPAKNIFSTIRKASVHWPEYLLYLALCVVAMLPFLYLYLPNFQNVGGRSWSDVVMYSPTLPNLIGQDINNIFNLDLSVYHLKTGFPPLYLALFILTMVCHVCLAVKNKRHGYKEIWSLSLAVSCIVSLFLVILWDNGFSLWYFFFKFIPGASAIRGIGRWLTFITLPVSICFSAFADVCLGKYKAGRRCILPALALTVFLCNHSTVGVTTTWNAASENAFTSSVPAPPDDCEVFYLTDYKHASTANDGWEEFQMDAWAIAQTYDLKTLNGYSGMYPDGWDLYMADENIDAKATDWMERNSADDIVLYSYDLGTREWTRKSDYYTHGR